MSLLRHQSRKPLPKVVSHFLHPHTPSLLLQPILCLTLGLSLSESLCPDTDVSLLSHPFIKAVNLTFLTDYCQLNMLSSTAASSPSDHDHQPDDKSSIIYVYDKAGNIHVSQQKQKISTEYLSTSLPYLLGILFIIFFFMSTILARIITAAHTPLSINCLYIIVKLGNMPPLSFEGLNRKITFFNLINNPK